jgi:hypothetical protein
MDNVASVYNIYVKKHNGQDMDNKLGKIWLLAEGA